MRPKDPKEFGDGRGKESSESAKEKYSSSMNRKRPLGTRGLGKFKML